jgi:hypothetical protein
LALHDWYDFLASSDLLQLLTVVPTYFAALAFLPGHSTRITDLYSSREESCKTKA